VGMKRYDFIGTAPAQPSAEPILGRGERMSRETPVHPLTILSHAVLPAVRAMFFGVLIASILGVSMVCFGASDRIALLAWVLCFLIITVWRWIAESAVILNMTWSIEERTGQDLNLDGIVGRPTGPLVINARRGQVVAQAQADDELLRSFADFVSACLTDDPADMRPNTEDEWCPRPLKHDTYVMFRDALVRGGYARWRSPRHNTGWEFMPGLTAQGVLTEALADRPGLVAEMHGQVSR
jgi:hypothetical protein